MPVCRAAKPHPRHHGRNSIFERSICSQFLRAGRMFCLPLFRAKPEERAGVRRFVSKDCPSFRLSPRSFLTGREGKNAQRRTVFAIQKMRCAQAPPSFFPLLGAPVSRRHGSGSSVRRGFRMEHALQCLQQHGSAERFGQVGFARHPQVGRQARLGLISAHRDDPDLRV